MKAIKIHKIDERNIFSQTNIIFSKQHHLVVKARVELCDVYNFPVIIQMRLDDFKYRLMSNKQRKLEWIRFLDNC